MRKADARPVPARVLAVAAAVLLSALPGCVARQAGDASTRDPLDVTATHAGDGGQLTADPASTRPGTPPRGPGTTSTTSTTTTSDPSQTSGTVTVTETHTQTQTATQTSTSSGTTDPSTTSSSTTTSTSSESTTSTSPSSDTSTSSSTSEPSPPPPPPPPAPPPPPPPPNVAPEASLVAIGQSGPAPYSASFTIDGFDQNGDALTWEFRPEGPAGPSYTGTQADFPFSLAHEYQAAGNYTAILTVSDGALQGTDSADIFVT